MTIDFSVTLSALRRANACFAGYNRVVRSLQGLSFTAEDEERESYLPVVSTAKILILSILESNGIDDAIWALRCVEDGERDHRLFAVWCARRVQHLMRDMQMLDSIDVAERFANSSATEDELKSASLAAYVLSGAGTDKAERYAARAAMYAAKGDARGAGWAAAGAMSVTVQDGKRAERAWQREMLVQTCNGEAPWQKGV